jgi:hypothetical protein
LGVSILEVVPAMKKPLTFILSFLLVICVASLIVGAQLNSASAFALSSAALVFFVAIFVVGVLDYKIGGSQVTLERRVGSLEKENTELKTSVTALLKSLYAVADGASRWDGVPKHHHDLIDKYLEPINHLIPLNIKEQVKADIKVHFPDPQPVVPGDAPR